MTFEKKLPSLQARLVPKRAQAIAFPDARLSPPAAGPEAGAGEGAGRPVRDSARARTDLPSALASDQDLRYRPGPHDSRRAVAGMDRRSTGDTIGLAAIHHHAGEPLGRHPGLLRRASQQRTG